MTFDQLKSLFTHPLGDIICEVKNYAQPGAEETFKVCWYGSAGGDVSLLDYFHPAHSLIGEPVTVFFFTDIDYVVHDEGVGWNGNRDIPGFGGFLRRRSSLKLEDGSEAPAMISLIPNQKALAIHIRADDSAFERLMLRRRLKIDVVSYVNGMLAGPGPRDLYGLRADFSFGEPREARPEWTNGIEWTMHEFGFTTAQGFCLIPLSRRYTPRELEFCMVVRLPSFLQRNHSEESPIGFTHHLTPCSSTELQNAEHWRTGQMRLCRLTESMPDLTNDPELQDLF